MENNRIYYLDVIRCIACMLVILMHAPLPNVGHSGNLLCLLTLIAMPCIGLFFMVSGALLLPIKTDSRTFLKHRLTKVIWPTVIWSIISIITIYYLGGYESPTEILKHIISVPFSASGHKTLWFMYVLIGLYLLAPIISPWLERASRRELKIYLAIWAFSLFLPYLRRFAIIQDGPDGLFYYLSGYIGYFILGHYLHRYQSKRTLLAILLIIAPFAIAVILKVSSRPLSFNDAFSMLSLPIAGMCYGIFVLVQNAKQQIQLWSDKTHKALEYFSNCTFGIYLIHIFIMYDLLRNYFNIARLGQISLIISFFGTLVISFIVTAMLSFLPCAQYLVGFRTKIKKS